MVIRSNRHAYLRHHVCESVLLLILAAPLLVFHDSGTTVLVMAGFLIALPILGYVTDMASSLQVDDDGLSYLEGGVARRFLAWSEIGELVPRRFRGWPAEDAVVALGRDGRPLLVAGVSMFKYTDVVGVMSIASEHVPVAAPVFLSPLTARADGRRRPELAPQRTSERLFASAFVALLAAAVVTVAILIFS